MPVGGRVIPGLRSELTALRASVAHALGRIDRLLAIPDDAEQGRTKAAIVLALERAGEPVKPAAVVEALQLSGRNVKREAVYQALGRMAAAGEIRRVDGMYEAKERT